MIDRDEVVVKLGASSRLAHEVLFAHRHPIASPDCHLQMIDLLHADTAKGIIEAFRSGAKSTRAEEAIIIKGLYRRFKFALIVAASQPRANERLRAIKNELSTNKTIDFLFGKQEGETWGESRIVLTNQVCIQAVGSGVAVRGIRYLDWRPDFVLIDDLEDEETVKDPEQREKTLKWLTGTLMPALSEYPPARLRMLGNRLDDDAVVVRLSKDPAWRHIRIPVMEQAEDGVERYDLPPGRWRSNWPAMFPLDRIAAKRAEYERLGMLHSFNCEYMCEAADQETRIFKASQEKQHAGVHTWQATFAAYDPARTVKSTSASTGVAVFSWLGPKLVVWRGDAQLWLPNEIVDDIFATDNQYAPVEIGVEATGLEEFIMQPLRHQALQRHRYLPLRRLVPPKGKDSFIRGLQPFFKSGEIEFVDVSAEARGQLLSFPSGRKDFPNALAYALMMKPGLPIYDTFSVENITDEFPDARDSKYLVTNATNHFTTAMLVQIVGGQVRVLADWVMEGPPGETLDELVGNARVVAGSEMALRVPPLEPGAHDTVGLRVAAREIKLAVETGGSILRGRLATSAMLSQRRRQEPLLVVCTAARWTLNALSGGFARGVDKRGVVSDEPVDGAYRTLMEGLESFVARYRGEPAEDHGVRYAVTDAGREYKTILPSASIRQPTKDQWHEFDDGRDVRTSVRIMPRR